MSKTTLADIERLCWHLSGWQVDQRSVDALLKAVTEYAGYGPDEPGQDSGAGAPWSEGGAGGAVRPAESLSGPSAADDTPEPANGSQNGVQRVEVTGTLTLVCPGLHMPISVGPVQAPQLVPEGKRRCTRCGGVQDVDQFFRKSSSGDGRRSVCRTCDAARKRARTALRKAA